MNLYTQAFQAAIRVDFLSNSEEFYLYAGTLYDAMVWGEEEIRKNKELKRKNMIAEKLRIGS
ncbi:hypothetical protein EV202_13125 [Bacteroides heparinolyticus]|uniref:Uncharacterized protein n=2 Tax=Prevotella heparinolytica TaxID=28113 RepID=A0A4R2LKJ7_9BACE|nr:hypothetical protein EV202_13125 [Bacteroides heparinolyticus]